jgi:alkylated DNA repair dioxygenase AlkB
MQAMAEEACGTKFNSCLLNLYRTGDDKVGWHADDESLYGKNSTICSISLGQSREFQLRERANPSRKMSYSLGEGDVFVMKGVLLYYNCEDAFWAHSDMALQYHMPQSMPEKYGRNTRCCLRPRER